MTLTREAIVEHVQQIVGADQVITDHQQLLRASVDNFRKLQNIFGVYTMLVPAAVVMARSTDDIIKLLAFADEHRVNVVARTGGTATEGGLESGLPNSIVIDGSLMNEIVSIDAYNMQATAQCGVPLQALEDRVRELGLTTGHSPQSKPIASMAASWRRAALVSSPPSTAGSRTWLSAAKSCSPVATWRGSRTCHDVRQVPTFATS